MLWDRRRFVAGSAFVGADVILRARRHAAAAPFDLAQVAAIPPGGVLALPAGPYNGEVEIEFRGRPERPVTLMADPPFATKFRGPVKIRGNYGILDGIAVEGAGYIDARGKGHVIRDSAFRDGGAGRALTLAGQGHSVERCLFERWDNYGVVLRGTARECRVLECLFDNRRLRGDGGMAQGAAIRLGQGDKDAYQNVGAMVERCRIVGWDVVARADKVLTIKSSGNIIRSCHFEDCDARVQVRLGTENTFEGCRISGCRAMRILDYRNRVLGCVIENSLSQPARERGLVIGAGNHPSFRDNGGEANLPGSKKAGHPRADAVEVAGCTVDFTNIGSFYKGHDLPARDTMIRQHRTGQPINLDEGRHVGTDYQPGLDYPGRFAGAVRLVDGDVGPRYG